MLFKSKLLKYRVVYKIRCFCTQSSLGLWDDDINTEVKLKIEKHWSDKVTDLPNKHVKNKTYYVLPMFPYPSGNLHMGHVRVYSISDSIARFQRLVGNNVIHPMGWDAFGLPAENAAIEHKVLPSDWTTSNIKSMKKQLISLGFNFDWKSEVSTCDPSYYKWTQYIFLKLFEKDLAYKNKSLVNWDPVDKTVLADEQVDNFGCSWRSGAKVEKKYLNQWFIKTTKFAKNLFDGLDTESLENWKDIVKLQKHWIGECNGIAVCFLNTVNNQRIEVWSNNPHKFLHGEFLVVSRNNTFILDIPPDERKNLMVINPITNSKIPIYISDQVNYAEGRDIYIGSPKTDQEDIKLAKLLNIPVTNNYDSNLTLQEEDEKAINIAKKHNVGGYYVSSKLKDWLISRQRYWGTPIPIIYCDTCGTVPVPYKDLPVSLPSSHSEGTGIQTLDKISEWVNCVCPNCSSAAKRETDTMDTFVDSSWYYYRFLDPKNMKQPFDKEKVCHNIPVDIYIGGKEHAVLHLYYARFMSYFLHSLGLSPSKEPFKKLLVQGMVMGQSFKLKSSGKYLPQNTVEKIGKRYIEKKTGESVVMQWEKMSKSKHNGENPTNLLNTYGCDTTRLLILADVAPETSRNWSDATFPGILNWQRRLWITIRDFLHHRNSDDSNENYNINELSMFEEKLFDAKNYHIATTTFHFKYSQKLSVAISRMQGLTNALRNNIPPAVIRNSKEYEQALASLIIMLAPVAPHFSAELWAGLLSASNRICKDSSVINWDSDIFSQNYPTVDQNYKLPFLCKIDGTDRCKLEIEAATLAKLSEVEALKLMLKQENIEKRVKKGILRTKFELYPECKATLDIFTVKKEKKLESENKISVNN